MPCGVIAFAVDAVGVIPVCTIIGEVAFLSAMSAFLLMIAVRRSVSEPVAFEALSDVQVWAVASRFELFVVDEKTLFDKLVCCVLVLREDDIGLICGWLML